MTFADGQEVPKLEKIKYLGGIIEQKGDAGPEVAARIAAANVACKALRPRWATNTLETSVRLRVLRSCVFSRLMYGLHTLYMGNTLQTKVDNFQMRCVRKALKLRSTYASKLIGEEATPHRELAHIAQSEAIICRSATPAVQAAGAHLEEGHGGSNEGSLIRQAGAA